MHSYTKTLKLKYKDPLVDRHLKRYTHIPRTITHVQKPSSIYIHNDALIYLYKYLPRKYLAVHLQMEEEEEGSRVRPKIYL